MRRRHLLPLLFVAGLLACSAPADAPLEPPSPTPPPDASGPAPAPVPPDADLVAVTFHALDTEDDSGPIVILKAADGRFLPIWIGPAEAWAIALETRGVRPPRPMTHDLIVDLIAALDAEMIRLVITQLKESTYHARLELRRGDRRLEIDSRPSDGIAIALRAGAPVFASAALLQTSPGDARRAPPALRGLRAQELTPTLREAFGLDATTVGVLVAEVEPASDAAVAGLLAGDIITAAGGREVASRSALRDACAGGGELALELIRRGEKERATLPATAGGEPSGAPSP